MLTKRLRLGLKLASKKDVLQEIWNGVLLFQLQVGKIKSSMYGLMLQLVILQSQLTSLMIGKNGGRTQTTLSCISSLERTIFHSIVWFSLELFWELVIIGHSFTACHQLSIWCTKEISFLKAKVLVFLVIKLKKLAFL